MPPVGEEGTAPGIYDMPPGLDASWVLQLVEIKELPEEIKLPLIKLILNTAAKTNIQRPEIPMHLLQYDLIWQEYKIFVNSGKLDPELKVIYEMIRHELELQLNRSVEGWQGELLFTKRYDIQQSRRSRRKRKRFGLFRTKKGEEEEEMEA